MLLREEGGVGCLSLFGRISLEETGKDSRRNEGYNLSTGVYKSANMKIKSKSKQQMEGKGEIVDVILSK